AAARCFGGVSSTTSRSSSSTGGGGGLGAGRGAGLTAAEAGFFAGAGAPLAVTGNGALQAGHLTRLPTRGSGTLAAWPQPGHLVVIMACLEEGLAPPGVDDPRRAPTRYTRALRPLPVPIPPVPLDGPRENGWPSRKQTPSAHERTIRRVRTARGFVILEAVSACLPAAHKFCLRQWFAPAPTVSVF